MADERSYRVTTTTADILSAPDNGQTINKNDSQLIFGEDFIANDIQGDWIYGRSAIDGYEGYVHQSQLKLYDAKPTHFITRLLSHIYPEPSFKTRPLIALSLLSRISVSTEQNNGFIQTNNGWVFKDHIAPLNAMHSAEPLKTALQFLGTPYLYGGRSSLGLDCSALVQLALLRNGLECPRDSHQQATLGKDLSESTPARGDLIFFDGHVGFLTSQNEVLSATARTMDTRIEPLSELIDVYGDIKGVRRIKHA